MVRRRQKGQGLTEFALILPILLLVLLGIIEAARIIWAYITIQNAAREAVRYAVTGQPLDPISNEPWTMTDEVRVRAIKEVAVQAASALAVDRVAGLNDITMGGAVNGTTAPEFLSNFNTPGSLGVLVSGQSAVDTNNVAQVTVNHPGLKGLSVSVEVYYNIKMFDPIYDTLLGGRSIHLHGEALLQNEGLNMALGGELPEFAPPPGSGSGGGGGSGQFDQGLEVIWNGTATNEVPPGSEVDIQLNNHELGNYYICFDRNKVTDQFGVSAGGDYLWENFFIVGTTPPGLHHFTSHLVIPGDSEECSDISEAATKAITVGTPNVPDLAINDIPHQPHPWPDNSLVKVQLVGHEAGVPQQIYFDGAPMLTDLGGNCIITPAADMTGQAECVIPNGKPAGSYLMTTGLATSTVEVLLPSLIVQGNTYNVYDGMTVRFLLREHAPRHNYNVFFGATEIPLSAPNGVPTNDEGAKEVSFEIPLGTSGNFTVQSQDRKTPPPPDVRRQIAATAAISVSIPTKPLIVVEDGNTHRAGEVIFIHVRRHSPNTNYDLKFDGTIIDGDMSAAGINPVLTDNAGDEFNIQYKIPISAQGVKSLVTYLENTNSYSATLDLTVLPQPYITITGGDRHAPGELITINLNNHTRNATYDVYLDGKLIRQGVVVDNNGNRSFQYLLPLDITPLGLDNPHPIASRRNNNEVAVTNLFVLAADLVVTAITPPLDPQPGVNLPIPMTIKNNSAITLTGLPFDNDLYVNPRPGVPNAAYSYPPGEAKIWVNNLAPSQTVVITPIISVYHMGLYNLYGRTDTSNKVVEGPGAAAEANNIMPTTMLITCTLTPFTDGFSDGVVAGPGWTMKAFGNASPVVQAAPDPAQLLAMAKVDPAALILAQPARLPVVAAALPVPLSVKAQPPALVSAEYTVQPAAMVQPAAAGLNPALIPQQQGTINAPQSLTATANGRTQINLAWQHNLGSGSPVDFFNDDFSGNSDGWTYADINNGSYVAGSYTGSTGNPAGSLNVNTSGSSSKQDNLEGGWTKSFDLDLAQTVTVAFDYRVDVNNLDNNQNENGQARVRIDNGTSTTVRTETVSGDSGWRSWSGSFNLAAGFHTITLIGFNNTRNSSNESVNVWFDNVRVSGTSAPVTPTSFDIERSPDGSTWEVVGSVPYAQRNYSDNSVSCGTAYSYRVLAVSGGNRSGPSNVASATTAACPVFNNPPTNLTVISGTNTVDEPVMTLTWQDNSADETEFRIERSTDGSNWTQIATVGPNVTTFEDNTISCNIQYSYRVIAYRSSDGAISVPTNVASATNNKCPATACTQSSESAGVLTLCSRGSGILQANDANGGYLFMNRQVNSFSFDMSVKLNSVPDINGNSLAGLEVRETLNDNARKVELIIRKQNTQQVGGFQRATAGGAVTQVGGWTAAGGDVPTWLRIVRANGNFYFYYNTSNDVEAPVLGAWSLLGSAPDKMAKNVYVGMINASASNLLASSRWEQFQVGCLAIASGNCGPVKEEDGMVVINAINYTDNFESSSSSDKWLETSTPQGYAALAYNGGNYTGAIYTNAPMLEYTVNIEQPGKYYVWVLGYAPDSNGNSVHVGLNGLTSRTADKIQPSSDNSGLLWINTTTDGDFATLELSQGVHTINVWGREDDFRLVQILLTNKPNGTAPGQFRPTSGTVYNQSACLVPVPPELPPNLTQCNQVLQNTSFEDITNPIWFYPGSENVGPWGGFNYPQPSTSFSLHMPAALFAGNHNSPYLVQEFQMPAWINGQSTATLSLFKAVQKLPNVVFTTDFNDSPNDHLYFRLLDENGTALTKDVLIATGADNTADGRDTVDPRVPGGGSSALADDDWVLVSKNVFDPQNFLVDPQTVAGKTVQAYFFAPNPGATNPASPDRYTTRFYLDVVRLNVCTSQPEPPPQTGKGKLMGEVMVFINGALQRYQGVQVWAYKVDGPLQTTYTINSGPGAANFSFHNLDPGTYVVYAQFVNSDGFTYGQSTSIGVDAGKTSRQNLVLVLGG